MAGNAVPPRLYDAHRLLSSVSARWNAIGRGLNVSGDCREGLSTSLAGNGSKLETVLSKWLESYCTPPTWDNLLTVLEEIELVAKAVEIEKWLTTNEEAITRYHWTKPQSQATNQGQVVGAVIVNQQQTNLTSTSVTNNGAKSDEDKLDQEPKNVKEVYDQIYKHSDRWKQFGEHFSVSKSFIGDLVRKDMTDDQRLDKILEEWYETVSAPFKWKTVIEALEKEGRRRTINEVKEFLKSK